MLKKVVAFTRLGLRFLGYALVFVATLEICARVDDVLTWGAPLWGRYDSSCLYVCDHIGKHGRPNGEFQKWKLNQFGFRGRHITKDKPLGVFRIVVMGASESFGQAESPGMEYPAQLQTILDQARPGRYEVINAAVPGMSLPRINEFLSDYVYKSAPDLLVLYPVAADYLNFKCPKPRTSQPIPQSENTGRTLRLFRRLKVVVRQLAPPALMNAIRTHVIHLKLGQIDIREPWASPPPERLAAYENHLGSVLDQAMARDIAVLLATHANRFGDTLSPKDREWLIAWKKSYPLAGGDSLIQMDSRANTIIRKTAEERDTYLVDLAEIIPPGGNCFSDAIHFTDSGASLAARALAKKLLEIDGGTAEDYPARVKDASL